MINVPAEAYKAAAAGEISAEELVELEKTADVLSKLAAPLPASMGERTLEALRNVPATAINTGVGAGLAVGGALTLLGAQKLHRMVKKKIDYNKGLAKIVDVYPDIKDDYGDRDIHLAYSALRHLNPHLADDPLVGGTLLGQVLRNRDIHAPGKAPRFDPGTARELYTAQPKYREDKKNLTDVLEQGLAGGMGPLQSGLQIGRVGEHIPTEPEKIPSLASRRRGGGVVARMSSQVGKPGSGGRGKRRKQGTAMQNWTP